MKRKYVIVGAGITGLFLAALLKDEDYIIIEKDIVPGGYCKSFYEQGFVWDCAGHFFHFADEKNKAFFSEVFYDNHTVKKNKNTKIYYKGKYIDYPFQCNIHQLAQDEFLECLYDLYFKDNLDSICSFKEMLFAKFGKSIAEKFLIPYNEKLYACDLNNLDADAMGRFFPYASFEDILKNIKDNHFSTYNNSFMYPSSGAQTVINYLLGKLEKDHLCLNTQISSIDINKKVLSTDKGEIEYEYLLSTIPFPHFLKLCGLMNSHFNSTLTSNKVLVLNMGFDKNSTVDFDWIYYPSKEYNFYRVGFYNNILGTDRLSIYVEIGFNKDAFVDIKAEKEKALINLKKTNIIGDHKLVASNEILMDPAYVHISKESENIKMQLMTELNKDKVFFAGRYGQWTYCSMEDCFNQAKDVLGMIKSSHEDI